MDYQDDYLFPGDEDFEVDVAALEEIYQIKNVDGCDSWKLKVLKCAILSYHAIPIVKDFCKSKGALIGRVPGRLEIFYFAESQLIGILCLERWVESESILAQNIWRFIGKCESILNVECTSAAGDFPRLEFATTADNEKFPGWASKETREHATVATEIFKLAKNENIKCSIHRLIYQGYRPSISSMMELAATLPSDLEIPSLSIEEMRKSQSKHLVFEEAAVMYL